VECYIDFMDSYFAHGGEVPLFRNFGAALAVSEHDALSGKDFLVALAVAYQVETALTAAAPFMVHGFDLTTPLTYSLGPDCPKHLGWTRQRPRGARNLEEAAEPIRQE
jgi:2-methylcitrate dehydratase